MYLDESVFTSTFGGLYQVAQQISIAFDCFDQRALDSPSSSRVPRETQKLWQAPTGREASGDGTLVARLGLLVHPQEVTHLPSAVTDKVVEVLAARQEVLDAYIFGSWARGDAQGHSDIDVAVYLQEEFFASAAFSDIDAALAADLMSTLGMNQVDVVILNQAPPLLYHRVLRDGIRVLSRHPAATTTREGRAYSRYCDYVPQLDKIRAANHLRMKAGAFGR